MGLGNRRLRNVALSTLEIPYIEGSIPSQTGDPVGKLEEDLVQFPCIGYPGFLRVVTLGVPGSNDLPDSLNLLQPLFQLVGPPSDAG